MIDASGVLNQHDEGGVRLITLNRPDKLNAFNEELWHALADAMESAASDDTVRCAVITGNGRAFTAGQDLGLLTGDDTLPPGAEPGFSRVMPVIQEFPKPLIAAVNGIAAGSGLTLLLHCDIVLMAESARVKVPFLSLGVTTEAAASVLLAQRVGSQRAAEIIFTEPWVSATEAVQDGLALRSVADDDLLAAALDMATTIAGFGLESITETKQLMIAGRIDMVQAATNREDAAFERLISKMRAD